MTEIELAVEPEAANAWRGTAVWARIVGGLGIAGSVVDIVVGTATGLDSYLTWFLGLVWATLTCIFLVKAGAALDRASLSDGEECVVNLLQGVRDLRTYLFLHVLAIALSVLALAALAALLVGLQLR